MTIAEARRLRGATVVYRPTGETGVITSVNERYVFVRYGINEGSAATEAQDLDPIDASQA